MPLGPGRRIKRAVIGSSTGGMSPPSTPTHVLYRAIHPAQSNYSIFCSRLGSGMFSRFHNGLHDSLIGISPDLSGHNSYSQNRPVSMASGPSPPLAATGDFGPLHVLQPQAQHSHTAIMLHGLGSTGEEFAEELFASSLSDGSSLRDQFPGCRWVFPSSKELWSSTFQENMPAWFEAPSLTDTTAGQDLQAPGIRASVSYLCGILDDEISLVGGPEKVVLGGISQGGAIATWTLLCHPKACGQGLCAFVGASTWLPFAADVEAILSKRPTDARSPAQTAAGDLRHFVAELLAPVKDSLYQSDWDFPLLQTPVFMGHGLDDAYVDVGLGREAARILSSIGFEVEWKDYSGAEQEGHWLKVPEEVDDIRAFLARALARKE